MFYICKQSETRDKVWLGTRTGGNKRKVNKHRTTTTKRVSISTETTGLKEMYSTFTGKEGEKGDLDTIPHEIFP